MIQSPDATAAWIVPNDIRFTDIDTDKEILRENIPSHPITFTQRSSDFIGKVRWPISYDSLYTLAQAILKTLVVDAKIVIDIHWEDPSGEILCQLFIYDSIRDDAVIIGVHRKTILDIAGNWLYVFRAVDTTRKLLNWAVSHAHRW